MIRGLIPPPNKNTRLGAFYSTPKPTLVPPRTTTWHAIIHDMHELQLDGSPIIWTRTKSLPFLLACRPPKISNDLVHLRRFEPPWPSFLGLPRRTEHPTANTRPAERQAGRTFRCRRALGRESRRRNQWQTLHSGRFEEQLGHTKEGVSQGGALETLLKAHHPPSVNRNIIITTAYLAPSQPKTWPPCRRLEGTTSPSVSRTAC